MDKKFWQSKKWISFIVTLLIVSGILIVSLVTQTIGWPLALFMGLGMLTIGVIAIAYINGQSTLDKFVEVAKGLSFGNKEKEG